MIYHGLDGEFFYRVTFDSDDDLTPAEWKTIGDKIRGELTAFEVEKFGKEGRLFYPKAKNQAEMAKKMAAGQKEYPERYHLALVIKKDYAVLKDAISEITAVRLTLPY